MQFLANKSLYLKKWCDIRLTLLLITNKKLHTGFRLAPKSMTLDDSECQNRGFIDFFGNFGLRHRFQVRIVPKSPQTDQGKLHMKSSTLDIVFTG